MQTVDQKRHWPFVNTIGVAHNVVVPHSMADCTKTFKRNVITTPPLNKDSPLLMQRDDESAFKAGNSKRQSEPVTSRMQHARLGQPLITSVIAQCHVKTS